MGVYNQFLGASGPIKKKRLNFAMFKFSFFTVTLPKMVDSAQNQSHPTHLSNLILIPNFSSLGLQMAEKIINMYFFGGQIHFLIFLDFLCYFAQFWSFFLAIFYHFRSGNLVLVLLASFGPFSYIFQTILGHFWSFLAILGSFCPFWSFFCQFSAILGQVIWCWYY